MRVVFTLTLMTETKTLSEIGKICIPPQEARWVCGWIQYECKKYQVTINESRHTMLSLHIRWITWHI